MIRRRARSFGRAEGGATAIEFAIVVGPLLLLMFATLEFGRMLWTREALQSAAIAGARCMASCRPRAW
jgi:Flp pilus assembly protein TadG